MNELSYEESAHKRKLRKSHHCGNFTSQIWGSASTNFYVNGIWYLHSALDSIFYGMIWERIIQRKWPKMNEIEIVWPGTEPRDAAGRRHEMKKWNSLTRDWAMRCRRTTTKKWNEKKRNEIKRNEMKSPNPVHFWHGKAFELFSGKWKILFIADTEIFDKWKPESRWNGWVRF